MNLNKASTIWELKWVKMVLHRLQRLWNQERNPRHRMIVHKQVMILHVCFGASWLCLLQLFSFEGLVSFCLLWHLVCNVIHIVCTWLLGLKDIDLCWSLLRLSKYAITIGFILDSIIYTFSSTSYLLRGAKFEYLHIFSFFYLLLYNPSLYLLLDFGPNISSTWKIVYTVKSFYNCFGCPDIFLVFIAIGCYNFFDIQMLFDCYS